MKHSIDYEKRYNSLVEEYQLTTKENRELRKYLRTTEEKRSLKNNKNVIFDLKDICKN